MTTATMQVWASNNVSTVVKKRDTTIDLLRGYFLLVIIIDHVSSKPSLLEFFTGRGRLWVSAAEGFFFLSGFMVGRIRGADVRLGNDKKASSWLRNRALQLYLVSCALTLLFTAVARVFDYAPNITLGVSSSPWWLVILKTMSLQYSYGLADMLPLYVIYLLLAIPTLRLLRRGYWWHVIALSLLVWLLAFVVPQPLRPVGTYFSILSWQPLFFGGVVFGYYNPEVTAWWYAIRRTTRIRLLSVVGLLSGIGLCASWLFLSRPSVLGDFGDWLQRYANKATLGPVRLLLFGGCIITSYHLVKHFEEPISRFVGWFLLPLGRNSLYVYVLHSIIIFPLLVASTHLGYFAVSLASILAVAIIWCIVIYTQNTKLVKKLF